MNRLIVTFTEYKHGSHSCGDSPKESLRGVIQDDGTVFWEGPGSSTFAVMIAVRRQSANFCCYCGEPLPQNTEALERKSLSRGVAHEAT